MLNCSLPAGRVPSYWLNAVGTPLPKVPHPTKHSDFRPISVTPYLGRIAEKIMVRNVPFIPAHTLPDQFAFKPTKVLLLLLFTLLVSLLDFLSITNMSGA